MSDLNATKSYVLTVVFSKVGRRTIYLWGCGGMAFALGIIGILGCFPNNNGAIWALGGLLIVLNFIYNITVGPICEYTLGMALAIYRDKEYQYP